MPRNSARKSSVTPTTTPRINSAIEKKLLGYAALATAAGVGALALAQPSEAEVIYTPTNQKIAGASLYLDLNGDGINDFFFQPRFSAGGHVKTFSTRSGAKLGRSASRHISPIACAARGWRVTTVESMSAIGCSSRT